VYTDKTYAEVKEMFDVIIDMFANFRDAIMVPNQFVLEHVIKLETNLGQMCNALQLAHVDQLLSGEIIPRASSPYMDILDSAQSLGQHVREMAKKILSLENTSRAAV
jgi:Na+/phosphate symporter